MRNTARLLAFLSLWPASAMAATSSPPSTAASNAAISAWLQAGNNASFGTIYAPGAYGTTTAITIAAAGTLTIPHAVTVTGGNLSATTGNISAAGTMTATGESHFGSSFVDPQSGTARGLKVSPLGIAYSGGIYGDTVTVTGLTSRGAADAISAAGTTQANATALAKAVNRATSCASGGFVLPAGAAAGLSIEIVFLNRSGAACTVYPNSGGAIEGGAANASVSVASGADVTFRSVSATAWYQ